MTIAGIEINLKKAIFLIGIANTIEAIVLIFGVESWVVATTITINLLRIVVTFIAFEIVKKGVTK